MADEESNDAATPPCHKRARPPPPAPPMGSQDTSDEAVARLHGYADMSIQSLADNVTQITQHHNHMLETMKRAIAVFRNKVHWLEANITSLQGFLRKAEDDKEVLQREIKQLREVQKRLMDDNSQLQNQLDEVRDSVRGAVA